MSKIIINDTRKLKATKRIVTCQEHCNFIFKKWQIQKIVNQQASIEFGVLAKSTLVQKNFTVN